MVLSFQGFLECRQGAQTLTFEFPDPSLGDLVDRYRIDEMQLLAAKTLPRDEVCLLEDRQMLRDGLARHIEPLTQFAERLAILSMQPVEKLPTASVSQSSKNSVVIHFSHMQPFSYLPIGNHSVTCQA